MSQKKTFLVLLSILATSTVGLGTLSSCSKNTTKPSETVALTYQIGLVSTADYSLTANKTEAKKDELIEINVELKDETKKLIGLEAEGVSFNKISDTKFTFSMPEHDVTIHAKLDDIKFSIEVGKSDFVDLKINKEDGLAKQGDLVTIETLNLDSEYTLKGIRYQESLKETWTDAVKVDESNYTILMPASNIKIEAVLEKKTYAISLEKSADYLLKADKLVASKDELVTIEVELKNPKKELIGLEAEGVSFNKVSDNKYSFKMVSGEILIKAKLVDKSYKIEIEKNEFCELKIENDLTLAKEGQVIKVIVSNIKAGYKLDSVQFKISGQETYNEATLVENNIYSIEMPGSSITLKAILSAITYNATFESEDQTKATLKATKDGKETSTYNVDDLLTLVPTINDDEYFVSKITYKVNGENEKELVKENGVYTLKMPSNDVSFKLYLACNEVTLLVNEASLENVKITKVEELRNDKVVNTNLSVASTIKTISGRSLRIYAEARHNPARVKILGIKVNNLTTIQKDLAGYYLINDVTENMSLEFVTEPVSKHTITTTNPSNLTAFAYIDGYKKSIPSEVYDKQDIKFYIKNTNSLELFDLENSGIYSSTGKKIASFKEVTNSENKEFETTLLTIDDSIEVRILTINKYLNRIYKAVVADSYSSIDNTLIFEVLSGSKVRVNITNNNWGLNTVFDGEVTYNVLTNGHLAFKLIVSGKECNFEVELSDLKVKFIKGDIPSSYLYFANKTANIQYLDKNLISTTTTKTDILELKKDGNATCGSISGQYEIKEDYGDYTILIGEEKFDVDLINGTYTYHEKASVSYFFVGKTYKHENINIDEATGLCSANVKIELVFANANEGNIIKKLVFEDFNVIKINETNLTYTVKEHSGGFDKTIEFELDGLTVELSACSSRQSLKFFNEVYYKGEKLNLTQLGEFTAQ